MVQEHKCTFQFAAKADVSWASSKCAVKAAINIGRFVVCCVFKVVIMIVRSCVLKPRKVAVVASWFFCPPRPDLQKREATQDEAQAA